jgi:hypothetical protein
MVRKRVIWASLGLVIYGLSGTATAQVLNSPNYSLPESYIGPGGAIDSSSPSYHSDGTVGDTATGSASSTNYGTTLGFNTTNEPRLAVVMGANSINFGSFSTATTSRATATFKVLNYTAHGYEVFAIGSTPGNGTTTLNGMGSTGPSQTGTEQFGMNLRGNTSPATFGSDPVQIPSSSFSVGAAATGYNTANNYRYVAGEKIAEALRSSGETQYTISYIVNVSTNTPGGDYSGAQSLVVVGTY